MVGRAPHDHATGSTVTGSPPRCGGRASTSTRWPSRSVPMRCAGCVFHIAAFEAMKGASLRPDIFDLGPLRRPRHASGSASCGPPCFRHVWGQWRYEHDLADYDGPDHRRSARGGRPAGRRRGGRVAGAAVLRGRQGQPGGGAGARGGGGAVRELRLLALHLRATRAAARADRRPPRPPASHRAAPALGVRRSPRRPRRTARARARRSGR